MPAAPVGPETVSSTAMSPLSHNRSLLCAPGVTVRTVSGVILPSLDPRDKLPLTSHEAPERGAHTVSQPGRMLRNASQIPTLFVKQRLKAALA